MEAPKNNWPQSEGAKHILFIGQTLRELVREDSFESFRAPSLDAITRFRELTRLCSQIKSMDLSPQYASSAIEEILHELEHDKFARESLGIHESSIFDILRNCARSESPNIILLERRSKIAKDLLDANYKLLLEKALLDACDDTKHKLDLHQICKYYIPLIINMGYAREHIRDITNSVFFNKDILRADKRLLSRWISNFDGKRHKFQIFLPIKSKANKFLKHFSTFADTIVGPQDIPPTLKSIVTLGAAYSADDHYIKRVEDHLDPYSAVRSLRRFVDLYFSGSVLDDRGFKPDLRSYAFVKRIRGIKYQSVTVTNAALQRESASMTPQRAEGIARTVTTMVANFDARSRMRFIKAMDNVLLARSSDTPENQLSLIWSAIETLFGDPPKGASRLNYYTSSIMPCIMINYAWRYSRAVFAQTNANHRKTFQKSFDAAGLTSDNSLLNFQRFCFDPEISSHHANLMANLDSNPGDRQLIFRFYKSFENPSALRRALNNHQKRVRWQINRIYRARNDFVHSGTKGPFVSSLSVNAFEYFRTCAQAIINHTEGFCRNIRDNSKEFSLDYIEDSIKVTHEHRMKFLSNCKLDDREKIEGFLGLFQRA